MQARVLAVVDRCLTTALDGMPQTIPQSDAPPARR
jgi:hypothetical protein